MSQIQCSSSTPTNPKTENDKNNHYFTSINAPNSSNLIEHITYLEKNKISPPKYSILQQPRNLSKPLNIIREESNSQEALFDGYKGFANLQAEYNWKLHMAQRNQQGNILILLIVN